MGSFLKHPAALWIILVAVLSFNVYRAVTQSLTIDEAFTYKDYIAVPWEEARQHVDPNNHVLYTLLAKLSTDWWGTSEWAIRVPSLAGGAIYMVACVGLVTWLSGSTWSSVVVFCALILNPMVLDYMSAARGYSLALGFLFCALLAMVRTFLKPAGKVVDAALHLAIGVALGLSSAANLAFLIPNGIVVGVFLLVPFLLRRKVDTEKLGIQTAVLLAGAGMTFIELMFGTFEGANVSTFSLGEASFMGSMITLYRRSLRVPTVPGGGLLPPLLGVVIAPLLIACFGGVIFYCLRKTNPAGKAEALLLFPLTLIGSAAALVILHVAIGLPYPYERTGIYFLPLMTLTVAAATTLEWKILSRAAVFLLCGVTLQYALEFKAGWYEEWRFDAGTKRAMMALKQAHDGQPGMSRMGISWVYETGATYYSRVLHMDWLAPVTREDPGSGSFDYYYLKEEDQGLVAQKGLVVLYRDPVSHAVLARPK